MPENENEKEAENGGIITLELIIWAKGLANLDKFSKSDPLCVLERNGNDGREDWAELGRTEAIMNNLDPKWNKKFHVDYEPGKGQELRFSCYDIDSDKEALTFHDFLGRCQCQIEDILKAPNGIRKMRLKKDTGAFAKGELFVHAERVELAEDGSEPGPRVHFEVRGLLTSTAQKQHHALVRNTGAAGNMMKPTAPSSYLEFYRIDGEGNGEDPLMVHRTEKVKSSWYPVWEPFEVPLRLLTQNGDKRKHFLIQCIDKESPGNKLVGTIKKSVDDLTIGHQWRIELDQPEDGEGEKPRSCKRNSQKEVYRKRGHLHFIFVQIKEPEAK